MARTDRASRLILAPPDRVYRALVDPALVVQWLPPKGARGAVDAFDPRPGGAFCITLMFGDSHTQGKSTSTSDVVKGQFVALEPNRHVTQSFEFESSDPAFSGTMTMTWTLTPHADGTVLAVTAENVPAGIRAEDHEAGIASSLANLAALIESARRVPE
jgi:uncharacterized protein YndB with AHSA1/START domain